MNYLAAAHARIAFLERKLAEARAELFIARNHRCRPLPPPTSHHASETLIDPPPPMTRALTRPMPRPRLYRIRAAFRRLSRRDRQFIAGVVLGYLGFLLALAVF